MFKSHPQVHKGLTSINIFVYIIVKVNIACLFYFKNEHVSSQSFLNTQFICCSLGVLICMEIIYLYLNNSHLRLKRHFSFIVFPGISWFLYRQSLDKYNHILLTKIEKNFLFILRVVLLSRAGKRNCEYNLNIIK